MTRATRGSRRRFCSLRLVARVSKTISRRSVTVMPTTAAWGAPVGPAVASTAMRLLPRSAISSARVMAGAYAASGEQGALVAQEPLLGREAAGVARERAVGADHAVAG